MEPEEPVTMQKLAGRITVYTITGCLHCLRTKSHLTEMGLPFIEVNIKENPVIHQQIINYTGRLTVPQIYFNNIHVGGNNDFMNLSQEELARLIDTVKNNPVPPDAPPIPEPETDEGEEPVEELKSERDEYAELVLEFKESGIIGSHWSCLKIHQNTFTGKKLVDWLMQYKDLDKTAAVDMAKDLTARKFLNPLSGKGFEDSDALYRLVEHDSAASLNAGATAEYNPISASKHSEAMRDLTLKLFSEHITPDGKLVDYKSMKRSTTFDEYCQLATQLQRVDLENLTRKEKLAFFINVYNALVIHGNIKQGPPKNMWQRYKFFNSVSYVIGGEVFTLQDIENGVLRGNRKGIAQITKPFSKGDPRLKVALEEAEPLIHFALNCGVLSCPPIKTYSAEEIDKELKISAAAFLDGPDSCQVDISKKEVRLSQIFKWYKVDFGGTDEKLLNWLLEHLGDSPKKKALKGLLSHGDIKIASLPYDWSTNSKD
ncbi:uncharacterized protein zgc:152951 [Carcharodon carcharias]|uniref:uncharacterized protein zgc:152951 n=1 Tax=Carcharodon carcharias TaxID=13397 RepID=UPI001B7EAB32|nr:uncharacterized protein zgc:152951 [Carcharodon carcharias]XP_041066708.1 uncharacterized protein zgc:152951 [Carcharodon carcharias]XP_041066709.1 uncharacterized protein zgc:152951 [Carcharodon carcharias]